MYKELLGYKIFSDNKEELLKEIENKKRVLRDKIHEELKCVYRLS